MRGPGDIVLVSSYELGHQPLSLASPLASLRRAGYAPVGVDLAVTPLAEAMPVLTRARLCAFSVPMHTALRLAVPAAAGLRAAAPAAHVAFYGLYAPLHTGYLRGVADSVLGAEAEEDLVALADALEAGRAPPTAFAAHPPRRLPLVAPERDGLPPLRHYAHLVVEDATGGRAEHRLAGYVEATRGCRHLCRHCPIPAVYEGRFFAVPVPLVLEDARRQIAAGARHITFGDPDFLNGPRHALAVARALHAEHPEVTFDATIKVEHIVAQREMFPELAALGCLFVVSAVESLSERVLDILRKDHTRADVLQALAIVRAAGLSLRPTFLPFTPWTTAADYLELCRFIADEDLVREVDPVQLSLRLLLPPGSLLLAEPTLAPHLGALDEERLTYAWTHPDPAMDRLAAEVAALVEEAAVRGDPPEATFARIFGAAARAAGATPFAPRPARRRPLAHLSEPWFC